MLVTIRNNGEYKIQTFMTRNSADTYYKYKLTDTVTSDFQGFYTRFVIWLGDVAPDKRKKFAPVIAELDRAIAAQANAASPAASLKEVAFKLPWGSPIPALGNGSR